MFGSVPPRTIQLLTFDDFSHMEQGECATSSNVAGMTIKCETSHISPAQFFPEMYSYVLGGWIVMLYRKVP